MNPLRLFLAIISVFVGIWITDFLIHGLWLMDTYKATAHLWRPEADMQKYFGWMMLGQLLAAAMFSVLWALGPAAHARIGTALLYGLCMGLFSQAGALITYAVQPLPGTLVAKWMLAALCQGTLMGLMVFFIYRPKKSPAPTSP